VPRPKKRNSKVKPSDRDRTELRAVIKPKPGEKKVPPGPVSGPAAEIRVAPPLITLAADTEFLSGTKPPVVNAWIFDASGTIGSKPTSTNLVFQWYRKIYTPEEGARLPYELWPESELSYATRNFSKFAWISLPADGTRLSVAVRVKDEDTGRQSVKCYFMRSVAQVLTDFKETECLGLSLEPW